MMGVILTMMCLSSTSRFGIMSFIQTSILMTDAILGASVFTAKYRREIEKQIRQIKKTFINSNNNKSLAHFDHFAKFDAENAFERLWAKSNIRIFQLKLKKHFFLNLFF